VLSSNFPVGSILIIVFFPVVDFPALEIPSINRTMAWVTEKVAGYLLPRFLKGATVLVGFDVVAHSMEEEEEEKRNSRGAMKSLLF
jgi:hypothetical protein